MTPRTAVERMRCHRIPTPARHLPPGAATRHLKRYISILDTPYSGAHLTPVPRFLATLFLLPLSLLAADRPSVGAIRWDAWSGGGVTEQVEQTLSPEKHRSRLPWFTKVDAVDRAHIDASADGIMEQEIAYAKNAGLNYWAFLTYPEGDAMSSALARYLRSPKRADLGFCLILHQTLSVPAARWPAERDRVIKLLQEPGYQKVGSRPLVFAFDLKTEHPTAKARFDELRATAKAASLEPYFIYMGWSPARDFKAHAAEGFAAVSAYAHPGTEPNFAKYVEAFERHAWANALATKTPYVPLVTTGWDKRPRQDHPVSWEKNAGYADQKTFPATATPAEIAGSTTDPIEALGLLRNLSPTRVNGLTAVRARIRELARTMS